MIYVGILGFGKLGQYIYNNIHRFPDYKISFVWNRTDSNFKGTIPEDLILKEICELKTRKCDLVIEVCHPDVVVANAEFILQYCDLMVGSPTAFCEKDISEQIIRSANFHAIYIPTGAMWGIEDIRKLNESNSLKALKITMEKHPDSFKLVGNYKDANEMTKDSEDPVILYDGPVKELCKIAPNNVNTMAGASLAASTLGFEKVRGCLIANKKNITSHIVSIEVESISGLKVFTQRINPAKVGHVTGHATFDSFLNSLKRANGAKNGLNFC